MIKTLIKNYENNSKELNKVELEWEQNPENLELENKYDSLYKTHYILFTELVEELIRITQNRIEKNIAKKMLIERYEDVKRLILKLA